MKYICTNCNFIYDDNIGLPEEGIAPHSFFSNKESFECPSCLSGSDNLFELQDEIFYFEDVVNISEVESFYYPEIEIHDNKGLLTIEFSNIEGNNEHRIISVVLLDEYGDIVLSKEGGEDEYVFDISDLDAFEIRIITSVHGIFSTGIIEK